MPSTDPHTDPSSPDTRAEKVERIEEEADAFKQHDRAIPLDDGEDDEGVGDVTQLVP